MLRHKIVLTLSAAACLLLAGCASAPPPADDTDPSAQADGYDDLMEAARAVAEDLNTPEKAAAAGYVPDKHCIPGMGVHWIHKPGQPDSHFDTELDLGAPEVLLFEPADANLSDPTGDRFLGVEYVAVTQGTPNNTTETVPALAGIPLDGPMPGHTPGMPWHAELHVYLADGIESDETFSETADGVTCPDGTTPPADGHGHEMSQDHKALLQKARSLAGDLNTTEKAAEAGYVPDQYCVPGMGVHWIHQPGQNSSYVDPVVDPDHPEVLLFEPADADMNNTTGDRFVGIEYLAVTEGTANNTTETVPSVMGVPMHGPMAGHAPGMPWHADLHIYLIEDVEDPFQEATDAVTCPDGTTPPAQGSGGGDGHGDGH